MSTNGTTPHLELVEVSDEDAFFDEQPAPELFDIPMEGPKRLWLWWGFTVLACVAVGLGGFWIGRKHEVPAAPPIAIAASPPVASVAPAPVHHAEPAPQVTAPPAAPKPPTVPKTRVRARPATKPAADPLTL